METFAKCLILFKFKEGENFKHRNILDISRIKIWAWRRNWSKWNVMQRSQSVHIRKNLHPDVIFFLAEEAAW